MVCNRWSAWTNPISSTVEILRVKSLANHITDENALKPILCFTGKIQVIAFFNIGHYSSHQDALFELVTATIGRGPCYWMFGPFH